MSVHEYMKRHGLALKSVIIASASVTAIYIGSVLIEAPARWILGLYFLSMAAAVWMAIKILKDPYTTAKTFDEYFYQDRDDIRRTMTKNVNSLW